MSKFMWPKVYVLELEDDRFYVGRATNFPKRVKGHIEGRGSFWTKMYRPIATHAFYWGKEQEEKSVTVGYMELYGINNVRGWDFSKGGDYDEEQVQWYLVEYDDIIPLDEIPVCDTMVPMELELSDLWFSNREHKSDEIWGKHPLD